LQDPLDQGEEDTYRLRIFDLANYDTLSLYRYTVRKYIGHLRVEEVLGSLETGSSFVDGTAGLPKASVGICRLHANEVFF
jgi:hypothetical protein